LLLIPLIVVFSHVLSDQTKVPAVRKVFLLTVLLAYIPLVPYLLEVDGAFAWATLPIVALYIAISFEFGSFRGVTSR
jgi:hypothetical protein